jgi:transposase
MAMINLNSKQAARLEALLTQARDARVFKRVQALLWLDEGDQIEEVAERLRVSRQTVYNWIARFEARAGLPLEARLADADRSGRPRTALSVIDDLIDEVIDQDPRQFGYRSTIWTAPLLQYHLAEEHGIEVCVKSVRLAINRLLIRWKRPRYHLALRDRHWQQAKGGSNMGSGGTSAL